MLSTVLSGSPAAGPLPAAVTDDEGRAFQVRAYRPEDRAPLEAFYAGFEPVRGAQGLPPEGAHRVARWLDRILAGGAHLVVEMGGGVVGHAMLIPADGSPVREYAIFLHQAVRGNGLGTAINRLAVEVAHWQGPGRLWLSVEPDNRAAVRSYEKAGWRFVPSSLYASELEMEQEV